MRGMNAEGALLPSGGYRALRSYRVAEALYDATTAFCDRFIPKGSRTHDQMVQAARSGARNIGEGSGAAATSRKTEMKLTNVALASLKDELIPDFVSFLRQRGLSVWDKDAPEALETRRALRDEAFLDGLAALAAEAAPECAANTLLCAAHQATYLLRRQLEAQEREFLAHGGFTERLYAARKAAKSDRSDPSDRSDTRESAPACPLCGKPMRRRTAHTGSHAGEPFWGCSGWPACCGLISIKESDRSDPSDVSDPSDKNQKAQP
jgi:four helix bundle suffix protein